MRISGTGIVTFDIWRFNFTPKTTIALKWELLSNNNWVSVDRGASYDIYESEISFYGTETEINNFISQIEANRISGINYFTLSQFNGIEDQLFGSNIDYSSSLTVTIIEFKKRKQKNFSTFTLDIILRLLPSYSYTGTATLPDLYPFLGYSGDNEYSINKIYSYDQTFFYQEHNSDNGIFEGTFIFNQTNMKNFRRYLLTTIRGGEMTINSMKGITYPFGANRSGFPITVKVLNFTDELLNINFWTCKLKLAESFD